MAVAEPSTGHPYAQNSMSQDFSFDLKMHKVGGMITEVKSASSYLASTKHDHCRKLTCR